MLCLSGIMKPMVSPFFLTFVDLYVGLDRIHIENGSPLLRSQRPP